MYSLENEHLKIAVNTDGAELYSLYSKKTNTEYLWQGDPAFWKGRAYNLFPFIGRMVEGRFLYNGENYNSRTHGLARYFPFALETQTEDMLVFLFTDNEDTHKEYPFAFEFRVFFTIKESTLTVRYEVTNRDTRTLICAFGGHPGINVPFGKGEFEDYYLEFSNPGEVWHHFMEKGKPFMANKMSRCYLSKGKEISLMHTLFNNDAVILENTGGCVCLKSTKDSRYVKMHYEDYPFIGFWQVYKPNTPFICLEPWSALPATINELVELETKPHMTHVLQGQKAQKSFTLEICE